MLCRNKAIKRIRELGQEQIEADRKKCKEATGYDKRSLVETAMWRFKRIFGGNFKSRKFENQETGWYVKAIAMNKMTNLGMLESK